METRACFNKKIYEVEWHNNIKSQTLIENLHRGHQQQQIGTDHFEEQKYRNKVKVIGTYTHNIKDIQRLYWSHALPKYSHQCGANMPATELNNILIVSDNNAGNT